MNKTHMGPEVDFWLQRAAAIRSLQLNSNVCFKPQAWNHHRL